jgi:rubrerythrin
MNVDDRWVCMFCGKPLDANVKACKVCDESAHKGKSPEAEICLAFSRALALESEGVRFYGECAKKTKDKSGAQMFKYLAGEEKTHFKKVSELFNKEQNKGYCQYVKESKDGRSGVFERDVPGGKLGGKSDSLDALNVGIRAEDNSIRLYEYLSVNAMTQKGRELFAKLVDEERRHRIILETEVEFVTDTGEFHDFKQVTF